MDFYDEYFKILMENKVNDQGFKFDYFKQLLNNQQIYKFISLDEDEKFNAQKLKDLDTGYFWASYHKYFEDKEEVITLCDENEVISSYGKNIFDLVHNLVETYKQLSNITSFTYKITDFMWDEYANESRGFCIAAELNDDENFWPVIYDDNKYDYTDIYKSLCSMFISRQTSNLSNEIAKFCIYPYVYKNSGYAKENEIRYLTLHEYDSYDTPLGGRIARGKKERLGIKGCKVKFEDAKLIIKKIIVGKDCNAKYKCELQKIADKHNWQLELNG